MIPTESPRPCAAPDRHRLPPLRQRPPGRALTAALPLLLVALAFAGCSSSAGAGTTSTPEPGTTAPAGTAGTVPRTDAAGTVWLCRPGIADDPCTAPLTAVSVAPDGKRSVQHAQQATGSKFDCFYVYPTVSGQNTTNANLQIQPAEVSVAIEQASRFSQVCRVWAPMYRQVTLSGLFTTAGLTRGPTVAFASLLSAWKDYLANFNDGRPIVFIGHSQGAAMLIRLLRSFVDPDPAVRKLLVSAIILGGNVQVPVGETVGGSFKHIPACGSATETGCVIAYSSFLQTPPANSLFGRAGQGVSFQSGQGSQGQQVVCTNPADLGGGSGALLPYMAAASGTGPGQTPLAAWLTYPDLYTARCESSGGATWLQVTDIGGPNDKRPRVAETIGPTWGLHLYDVNIALGNLVADVATEESAYR